jgi:hypothetical protein
MTENIHPYKGPGDYYLGCKCENCVRSSNEVGGFIGLYERYRRRSQEDYDEKTISIANIDGTKKTGLLAQSLLHTLNKLSKFGGK